MHNQFADSEFEEFDYDAIMKLGSVRTWEVTRPCVPATDALGRPRQQGALARGVLAVCELDHAPLVLAEHSPPQRGLETMRGPARQAARDVRYDGGGMLNGML